MVTKDNAPVKLVSLISRMNVGGPAVLLSEFAARLVKSEFMHILVTGRCEANEVDFLLNHAFDGQVIYLEELSRSVSLRRDLLGWVQLRRLLKSLRPDILHTHTSKAGLLGRTGALMLRRRPLIVHTYHGHLLYGYFPRWKSDLIVFCEKILATFSDLLIAVSEQVRDDLLARGIGNPAKWVVIHPGLDLPRTSSKSSARNKLGIDQNKFVICWIGRFTDIKDPLLAVEVFIQLEKVSPNSFHFIMAGDGHLMSEAKARATSATSKIEFPGWISDVNEILSASDLLLMTSKNEGMPVVILEAAVRGVPTMSTDVGGVKDFIVDNKTGYLIRPSISEMVSKIIEVIGSSQHKYVAEEALKLVSESFSMTAYSSKHLEAYKRLVKAKLESE